ncbi:hypothetical protein MPUL_34360 [Mycolicibacterium pulveris]|uniref:Uncharacterized protein n=1 Tax=Mycolicibacterium pulveris TaxID=36813 RepID=A0A7I7ULE3_MYCPV|nr:hypothetical protein MPUL_34360 [Mycolicibacterium pulveris]
MDSLRHQPLATWHCLAGQLTPEQIAFLWKCDRNPDHPAGPDAHRRGLVRQALMYSELGPGSLN